MIVVAIWTPYYVWIILERTFLAQFRIEQGRRYEKIEITSCQITIPSTKL